MFHGVFFFLPIGIFLWLPPCPVHSASVGRAPENANVAANVTPITTERSDSLHQKDLVRQANNDFFSNNDETLSSIRNSSEPTSAVLAEKSQDYILSSTFFPIKNNSGTSHISRSVQKCIEYRNIDSNLKGNRTCTKLRRLSRRRPSRIVIAGGWHPKLYTFAHVVALGKQNENNNFVFHCGGTLISSSWVLTAAHCTHGVGGGIQTALLGIRSLNDKNAVIISINRTIRHPSYKPPALYADIALLQLKKPVEFSEKLKPACLSQQIDYVPESASIMGWGATEFGGSESNLLQEAELEILDNEDCAVRHNRSVPVPNGVQPSMICAGAPNNNWRQDTCQGDSGGPLAIIHAPWPCLHEIIGITSFGSVCAFPDSPGVYTRISHYRDWIENIVWPENN